MIKFTPIQHQFTLFDYNEMRLRTKIPIKRISKERMEQAILDMKKGKDKNLRIILSDINDALERYDKRLTNSRKK